MMKQEKENMNDEKFSEWIATNYGVTIATEYRAQNRNTSMTPEQRIDRLENLLKQRHETFKTREDTRFSAIIRPLQKRG